MRYEEGRKKTLRRKNKNKLEDRCTGTDVAWEGGPERKEKKRGGGEGELIVKYEIVLQKGRY